MPRQVIPHDVDGYMVVDGTIHTRYATHVERGMRYRTVDEAFASVAGTAYAVCGTCYPAPEAPRPSRARARRAEAPEPPARVEVDGHGVANGGNEPAEPKPPAEVVSVGGHDQADESGDSIEDPELPLPERPRPG